MTVAIALAMRTEDGRAALGVVADSRLTVQRRTPMDVFIKAVELGPTSIVALAGDSILPGTIAAELTRPLVRNMHANAKASASSTPVSLLEEVRQLGSAYALVHRSLGEKSTSAIAAGHFSDGSPGLVKIDVSGHETELSIFRPIAGGAVVVGVGLPSAVGLAIDALQLAAPCSVLEALSVLANRLWGTIRSPSFDGIGGGLLLGFRVGPAGWCWPVVHVDGNSFYRGIPIDGTPEGWETNEFPVVYDAELLSRTETNRPPAAYQTHAPALIVRMSTAAGRFTTLAELPEDWRPTAREREILDLPSDPQDA